MQGVSLVHALKDALLVGVMALLVLGPISGLVLDGYGFVNELERPLILALIAATGRFFISLAAQTEGGRAWLDRFSAKSAHGTTVESGEKKRAWVWILLGIFVAGLILPFLLTKYWLTVFILAMIYVLLGMGLNIVVGLAGLLDLGYVAFYAIGAYMLALGSQYLGIGFWTALPLAAITAGVAGMVLGFPVLRMHGDYLAIVTLGFGEIIRLILNNWLEFTGGPNGASAPAPTFFGLEFSRVAKQGGTPYHEFFGVEYNNAMGYIFTYIVLFLVVSLAIMFVTRLQRMPMGRAWEALREDEIACRSLGINHVTVKLTAFMMGAGIGGIAGVFFATYQGFVNPSSFTFFESALVLAIVVLGGLGSTLGVILAALVLTIMPEVLREFADYRVLAFGILMVLMMLWRPRGLIRPVRPAFFPRGAAA
ncbi:MAG TPA: high-affinity branched-chain amino acid ABC transporter permease LivM [Candidatus Competibacteraceae bacterium]|nr:high-affinity branched-chain amino acid ABC transporter permease LivM [Candidatus Competibacteraceae bacterium]